MYSIIIQNNKTLDSFQKFHALFSEAVKQDKIGICKWNESGLTLDSAVLGLKEMTNGKEEWRAVIVRCADGNVMSRFRSTPENPFDFPDYESEDNMKESQIPLIRLTHMLGGIQKPEIKFVRACLHKIRNGVKVSVN